MNITIEMFSRSQGCATACKFPKCFLLPLSTDLRVNSGSPKLLIASTAYFLVYFVFFRGNTWERLISKTLRTSQFISLDILINFLEVDRLFWLNDYIWLILEEFPS